MSQKVVFIDRDDTICHNVPYCSNPNDLHLRESAGRNLFKLKKNGFLLILVTNQSGISRGFLTEEILSDIHIKLQKDLSKYNVTLDDIFYCPCLPDDKCLNRKPNTGMFEQAHEIYDVDFSNSYMLGDMKSDIAAGNDFGLKTILVYKPENSGDEDFFAKNLNEAIEWILKEEN